MFLRTIVLAVLLSSAFVSAQTIELPVSLVGKTNKNIFLLTLTVNDRPLRFIVDTGAEATVVNRDSFARYVQVGRDDRVTTLSGDSALEPIYLELTFGNRKVSHRAFKTNLDIVNRSAGTRIDGIIGQDFLSMFSSVSFDYKRKLLVLVP